MLNCAFFSVVMHFSFFYLLASNQLVAQDEIYINLPQKRSFRNVSYLHFSVESTKKVKTFFVFDSIDEYPMND